MVPPLYHSDTLSSALKKVAPFRPSQDLRLRVSARNFKTLIGSLLSRLDTQNLSIYALALNTLLNYSRSHLKGLVIEFRYKPGK
jgi:hypothetical protein